MKKQKYIIRCDRAGVFFGEVKERSGQEATLANVRKIWYWEGACAVEELAVNGTAAPGKCKLTVTVPEMVVTGVIQVVPCTDKAVKSLDGVEEWRRG